LKPVNVMFGITDNRNTEIAGGDLKAGDQVVVGVTQAADQSSSSGSRPMRLF
jgi:HlyD family secretion protein